MTVFLPLPVRFFLGDTLFVVLCVYAGYCTYKALSLSVRSGQGSPLGTTNRWIRFWCIAAVMWSFESLFSALLRWIPIYVETSRLFLLGAAFNDTANHIAFDNLPKRMVRFSKFVYSKYQLDLVVTWFASAFSLVAVRLSENLFRNALKLALRWDSLEKQKRERLVLSLYSMVMDLENADIFVRGPRRGNSSGGSGSPAIPATVVQGNGNHGRRPSRTTDDIAEKRGKSAQSKKAYSRLSLGRAEMSKYADRPISRQELMATSSSISSSSGSASHATGDLVDGGGSPFLVSAAGGSDDHSLVGEGGDLAHLAECSEPECSWKTPPVMELQVADRENWAEEFLSSASGSFVVYKERGGGEHNRSGTFVSFDEDLNLDPEVEADLLQESFDIAPSSADTEYYPDATERYHHSDVSSVTSGEPHPPLRRPSAGTFQRTAHASSSSLSSSSSISSSTSTSRIPQFLQAQKLKQKEGLERRLHRRRNRTTSPNHSDM